MQGKNLYWIDPPSDERPPKVVGREILSLYRNDFSLTTTKICKILHCERHWIHMTLKPLLKHISVSYYFRQFIISQFELSENEATAFAHSSNFYSVNSLTKFWRENAIATQKTRVIDLAEFVDVGSSVTELLNERELYSHTKRSKQAKEQHFARVKEILTDEGFRLYTAAKFRKPVWLPTALPVLPVNNQDLQFQTTADVMHQLSLNSDTAAIKWLINHGAVRIKLLGKTLWSVHSNISRWPIAVPLNYFTDTDCVFKNSSN